jgi:hypothetical protein
LKAPPPLAVAGLALAAPFAVANDWSLAEFCWSTWLAGLLFTWMCVVTGGVQIIATAPAWRDTLARRVPAVAHMSSAVLIALLIVVVLGLMALAFYGYTFAFSLYGVLLSVFAEMQPHSMFGRNGFINSDFWTPVRYLAESYWAMSAGTVVAYGRELAGSNPWKRMVLPLASEVVRVHIMVVLTPFLTLAAWAIFRDSYETIVIVGLMCIFYLLPRHRRDLRRPAAPDVVEPQHAEHRQ